MAIGDQAGRVAIEKINTETLPKAADLINHTLEQAAVIANGTLNGIEGERLLAMQGLKNDVLGPLLEESRLWRQEVAALNAKLDRILNGGLLLTVPKTPNS